MSVDLIRVQMLIHQALAACGQDGLLSGAKAHLASALELAHRAGSRKARRAGAKADDAKARKTKHDDWWAMLKKNAAENINNLEGSDGD